MKIRTWTYMDILRISELEKECFPQYPWSFQMLADSFSSEHFYGLLAEENGEAVAYGSMSFNGDDADIDNIAVSENYRRNGIGKALLEGLVEEAKKRNVHKMFLEVRVTNAPAQILYLLHGFKGIYVRSRYYPDGEDAIVMVKELRG